MLNLFLSSQINQFSLWKEFLVSALKYTESVQFRELRWSFDRCGFRTPDIIRILILSYGRELLYTISLRNRWRVYNQRHAYLSIYPAVVEAWQVCSFLDLAITSARFTTRRYDVFLTNCNNFFLSKGLPIPLYRDFHYTVIPTTIILVTIFVYTKISLLTR